MSETVDLRRLEDVLQSTSDVLFPEQLGEKQVDISSRGLEGDSPLHVLVWRKDVFGAQLVVTAGADVDAIGDMGETPLHVAVAQRCLPLIEMLLRAGARADIRSEFGLTASEMADTAGGDIGLLFVHRSGRGA
jgi:uncharacterized protein